MRNQKTFFARRARSRKHDKHIAFRYFDNNIRRDKPNLVRLNNSLFSNQKVETARAFSFIFRKRQTFINPSDFYFHSLFRFWYSFIFWTHLIFFLPTLEYFLPPRQQSFRRQSGK